MKIAKITPNKIKGEIIMPPSKSVAHRAIICASLSNGISKISPIELSNDILATINCVKKLGAELTLDGNILTVDGTNMFSNKTALLNCNESGSTLRFLIPISAVGGVNAVFVGSGMLPQRPIGIYLDCLPKFGVECITNGGLPLEIKGTLKNGTYNIPGNISSQFITGLLLALPLLENDSQIIIEGKTESVGYIDMTVDVMDTFGVKIDKTENGYFIKGGQSYKNQDFTVEGDWSQAGFFLAGGAIGDKIIIKGLKINTTQGDKEGLEIFKKFGANIEIINNDIIVSKGSLKAVDIDAAQIPDLVPILAVTASLCEGITKIYGAERLRIKECDRLSAITNNLNAIGAKITELSDGLIIEGVKNFKGGFTEGYNDHRIVMSMAVASICSESYITVTDAQSINKSYPTFFEEFNRMGGDIHIIEEL